MPFFPTNLEISEPEHEDFAPPPWWQTPEDEIPSIAATSRLLAATHHVAVALIGADVYRNGVEFRIERRLRRNGMPAREWNESIAVFTEHSPFGGRGVDLGRLRYGLVLGDGERVLDDAPYAGGADPTSPPEGHALRRMGSESSGGSSSFTGRDRLWLWPAPPAGPIEFVMQWPALEIDETRVLIDGDELIARIPHVTQFWE
jgi:hypothetical protein